MDINQYKDKIASRYIPVEPDQIGIKITKADYYLMSVKLDGHLGLLVTEKGKATLYNRSGKQLDLPAISNAGKELPPGLILAGEIVVFNDGKPGKNQDVAHALADPGKKDVRFAVFDRIDSTDTSGVKDIRTKFEEIKKICAGQTTIFAIEQQVSDSRKDIIAFYNSTIREHEGIVVRSANGATYKIKPVTTLDLIVLGYAEGIGERQGMIRELLLGYAAGKNNFQIVTHCGNGFTQEQRSELLKKLSAIRTDSEYTEVSTARIAFNMIQPMIVAELNCLDITFETSAGTIRKALLEYDPKKGYRHLGQGNSVSLVSPVFNRLREDKKGDANDAGLSQLSGWLPESEEAATTELKVSKIISREVFTKTGKGGTAVRKFTALKTNKEETGTYPPFVVVYSDFSSGRKTPLEQEVYLCSTKKEADEKIKELKEENIKKGWEAMN